MPEALLLLGLTGAVLYYWKWIQRGKVGHWILSLIFIVAAVLTKPQSLYLGLPLLYLSYYQHGWGLFSKRMIWLYVFLLVIVFVLVRSCSVTFSLPPALTVLGFSVVLSRLSVRLRLLDFRSYLRASSSRSAPASAAATICSCSAGSSCDQVLIQRARPPRPEPPAIPAVPRSIGGRNARTCERVARTAPQ